MYICYTCICMYICTNVDIKILYERNNGRLDDLETRVSDSKRAFSFVLARATVVVTRTQSANSIVYLTQQLNNCADIKVNFL